MLAAISGRQLIQDFHFVEYYFPNFVERLGNQTLSLHLRFTTTTLVPCRANHVVYGFIATPMHKIAFSLNRDCFVL